MIETLAQTELHVHLPGCLTPADVFALGREVYHLIDWDSFGYRQLFTQIHGYDPRPERLFARLQQGDATAWDEFVFLHTYRDEDAPGFDNFLVKFRFFLHIWWQRWGTGEQVLSELLTRAVAGHQARGLHYVEYRCGASGSQEAQVQFHRQTAVFLQQLTTPTFQACYIISIPRHDPLAGLDVVLTLLAQYPELRDTVVGVDFASIEEGQPPKKFRAVFERLAAYNRVHQERPLAIVYHVGESFYDKSLESTIRWCHEVALMGARRLGHAIVLGLDPAVAIARRPFAHVQEPVSERLDQIRYDLAHRQALRRYGVAVDEDALLAEEKRLRQRKGDEVVERPFTPQRLADIRQRQQLVLDDLARLGTVIECCPTGNRLIAGIPDPRHHPVHRFLAHPVNLAICTDNPGNFATTLADEIGWVLHHTHYTSQTLLARLGNPRRFGLPYGEHTML